MYSHRHVCGAVQRRASSGYNYNGGGPSTDGKLRSASIGLHDMSGGHWVCSIFKRMTFHPSMAKVCRQSQERQPTCLRIYTCLVTQHVGEACQPSPHLAALCPTPSHPTPPCSFSPQPRPAHPTLPRPTPPCLALPSPVQSLHTPHQPFPTLPSVSLIPNLISSNPPHSRPPRAWLLQSKIPSPNPPQLPPSTQIGLSSTSAQPLCLLLMQEQWQP